ncbi:MAG: OmpA family protein [Pseudomonadota bacterium]
MTALLGCTNLGPASLGASSMDFQGMGFSSASTLTVTPDTAARLAVAKWFAINIPSRVHFEPGSSQISERVASDLARQAAFMRLYPEFGFYLYGHADPTEPVADPVALSLARARAVSNTLRDLGVPPAQILNHIARGNADADAFVAVSGRPNQRVVTELATAIEGEIPPKSALMARTQRFTSP